MCYLRCKKGRDVSISILICLVLFFKHYKYKRTTLPLPPSKKLSNGGSKIFQHIPVSITLISNPVNIAQFCKHPQEFTEPERRFWESSSATRCCFGKEESRMGRARRGCTCKMCITPTLDPHAPDTTPVAPESLHYWVKMTSSCPAASPRLSPTLLSSVLW